MTFAIIALKIIFVSARGGITYTFLLWCLGLYYDHAFTSSLWKDILNSILWFDSFHTTCWLKTSSLFQIIFRSDCMVLFTFSITFISLLITCILHQMLLSLIIITCYFVTINTSILPWLTTILSLAFGLWISWEFHLIHSLWLLITSCCCMSSLWLWSLHCYLLAWNCTSIMNGIVLHFFQLIVLIICHHKRKKCWDQPLWEPHFNPHAITDKKK